jgi:hypothetical protein
VIIADGGNLIRRKVGLKGWKVRRAAPTRRPEALAPQVLFFLLLPSSFFLLPSSFVLS